MDPFWDLTNTGDVEFEDVGVPRWEGSYKAM